MSSFGKAMSKYFGSAYENSVSVSHSDPKPLGEDVDTGKVQDEQRMEVILNEKNLSTSPEVIPPSVRLDLARLKTEGIVKSDTVDPKIIEEYRHIKRPLLLNAFGQRATTVKDGNLIMVTSAIEGEGKSFTSLNLALSIAWELDRTVLLIDADLSRRGLSRMLDIEDKKGLSDILADNTLKVPDVLIKFNISKLTFLPAGQEYPNVAELLASQNMQCLTEEIAKRYSNRLILFDAPPLLATSQARVLAGLVGQILLVVEAERTTQFMVQEAISYLDSSKAIGLVLNKSRRKSSNTSYYYGYNDSNITIQK